MKVWKKQENKIKKRTTPKKVGRKKKKMNKAELGERVKIIRKHFGLSQAQFAQKINRSPGFISDIETGKSRVSEQTIKAICLFSGVNKEWLVSGAGEMGCGVAADKAGIVSIPAYFTLPVRLRKPVIPV